MRKNVRLTLLGTVAFLLALTCTSPAAGDVVIYQQTFDNATGLKQPLSTVNWQANIGPGATAASNSAAFVSPLVGDPNTPPGAVPGYAEFNTNFFPTPKSPLLAWTQDKPFSPGAGIAQKVINTISWYQGNSGLAGDTTPNQFRLAVRDSNGNWFVAAPPSPGQTTPVNVDSDFQTKGTQIALAVNGNLDTATTWSSLTFVPGTSLVEGGPSAGPVGNITAAGLFLNDANVVGGETYRFDTFTVAGLPEPSSMVLTFLGVSGGFVVYRLRGRRKQNVA